MKFTLALLATLVACSAALVILPEDFAQLNQNGQCASGLPRDGLFESGMLGSDPTSWRVGAWRSGKSVDPSGIKFQSGFTSIPQFFDLPLQSGSSSAPANMFSVRVPASGILFQYMPNLAYAHYRVKACARVHGESPCRIEIRNEANEIADFIEFAPQKNLSATCSSSNDQKQLACVAKCAESTSYKRMSIRYTGSYPTTVVLALPGQEDSGMMIDLAPGQEFNVTADLFSSAAGGNSTSNSSSSGASDTLPEYFEIIESPGTKQEFHDVFSTNCSYPTALPGMRFGDKRNYVLASAWDANDEPLCGVSDIADKHDTCACESDTVDEQCWLSDKGFVAESNHEYYIGLVSRDCSCSFDNVCLDLVDGDEGFFGLDWLRVHNATA